MPHEHSHGIRNIRSGQERRPTAALPSPSALGEGFRGEGLSAPGSDHVPASRRRLLGLLAALPLALGTGLLPEVEPAEAKKRKHKKGKGKGKGKKNRKHRRKDKKKGRKKGKHRKNHKKKRGGKGGNGNGNYSPDAEERAFLDLINDHRRRHGARALRLDNQLGAAAEHHSRDMAKKNYFKHTLSNGDSAEQNIRRFGYTNYRAVGENIAAGEQSASQIFDIWQKSNEHNRNMLDGDFADIGIGRAHGKKSKYGWYWTTTFGG